MLLEHEQEILHFIDVSTRRDTILKLSNGTIISVSRSYRIGKTLAELRRSSLAVFLQLLLTSLTTRSIFIFYIETFFSDPLTCYSNLYLRTIKPFSF